VRPSKTGGFDGVGVRTTVGGDTKTGSVYRTTRNLETPVASPREYDVSERQGKYNGVRISQQQNSPLERNRSNTSSASMNG
jgi:hypothetical protein